MTEAFEGNFLFINPTVA